MFEVGKLYVIDTFNSSTAGINKEDLWECICTNRPGPKYHPIILVNKRNGSLASCNELGYSTINGELAKFKILVKAAGPLDVEPDSSDLPDSLIALINHDLMLALAQRGLSNRDKISLSLNQVLNIRQKNQLIKTYVEAGWSDVIVVRNLSKNSTYIHFIF